MLLLSFFLAEATGGKDGCAQTVSDKRESSDK